MKAFAFLIPVTQVDEATTGTPISISAGEVTLGSDPNQSILVFDDLSVEGLHARLTRLEEGVFKISDEGSVAGTWVNYTPVSGEGVVLVHGDLIHIGRISFRFTQREQQGGRKPVIVLLETQA
jgi:pSer/pThr/pTyr-binding forkhead associated (FHA) protein